MVRWVIITFANTTCLPHRNRRTNLFSAWRGEKHRSTTHPSHSIARIVPVFCPACKNDLAVPVCCTVLIETDERYTSHLCVHSRNLSDTKRSFVRSANVTEIIRAEIWAKFTRPSWNLTKYQSNFSRKGVIMKDLWSRCSAQLLSRAIMSIIFGQTNTLSLLYTFIHNCQL